MVRVGRSLVGNILGYLLVIGKVSQRSAGSGELQSGSCSSPFFAMGDFEALFSQLRAAADVHGTDWLHDKVSELLGGAGQGGSPMAPSAPLRARRVRPPERLSPDVSPRVQRRARSPSAGPSRDPPAPAPKRRSAKGLVRPGRNPLPRRDPRADASRDPLLVAQPPAQDRDLSAALPGRLLHPGGSAWECWFGGDRPLTCCGRLLFQDGWRWTSGPGR